MDFRTSSKRVPESLFPGGRVRIYLGDPQNARERSRLTAIRETLKQVARLEDWRTLRRVQDRDLTPEAVHAAVKRAGLDAYPMELRPTERIPSLGEALDAWEDALPRDRRRRYGPATRRLREYLGEDTPMQREAIGRAQIRDGMQRMEREDLAHNTRSTYMIAWGAFFTWWIERETERHEQGGPPPALGTHPVRAMQSKHKVRVRASRHRFLTEEEWADLLEATSPEIRAHYATLLFCGLRPGELYHLRPVDVDLPERIHIRAREGWSPKGYERWGAGEGSIPVHRTRLLPLLEEHKREWAGEAYFFVNPRTGERWSSRAFRHQLKRDCVRAGVVYGRDEAQGITPHTFRHTIASWLAQRDVQLMKIAELLRDRAQTVATHYAHLLPCDLDETMNRVL